MGKINELFINLLQVYVYIAVIIGMVVAYNMGNQFGGGGYAVFMYILIVPLVFGLLLIQIDNNSLLRQIRDNAKPKIKGKTSEPKGDAMLEMKKMGDEAKKKYL